ncbi:PREDICTED: survival motor neuron protein [Bactrocera latifrons]|uniref:Survival motor neuron protein n=1 Tax=Bactrocera latifrons TaxID=174628 RepID=A0A0K8TX61_BACLA|nr:PREDICTED: survival motor neuron protein [Bactrocera latifrons]
MDIINKDFADQSWDESMLIKSYDECVKLGSEDVAKYISSNTNNGATKMLKTEQNHLTEFNVGDYVRSTYHDDGCDYEAKILSKDGSNDTCLVKYIGYDNEEIVHLKDLLPSWGKKARRLQFQQANARERKDIGSTVNSSKKMLTDKLPPPPPLPPMLSQNISDSEHLSAMLMSWYMSGYYTGIYEGIKLAKDKNK